MDAIQSVVETSFYVADLDRAEEFYRDVLGLSVIDKEAGRHVFFEVGGSMLLAFEADTTLKGDAFPVHGARGPGHFALGIPATALEAWRKRLEDAGVEIEKEIHWPRGGRSIYFRDPDANSVELLTPGVWGLPSGW